MIVRSVSSRPRTLRILILYGHKKQSKRAPFFLRLPHIIAVHGRRRHARVGSGPDDRGEPVRAPLGGPWSRAWWPPLLSPRSSAGCSSALTSARPRAWRCPVYQRLHPGAGRHRRHRHPRKADRVRGRARRGQHLPPSGRSPGKLLRPAPVAVLASVVTLGAALRLMRAPDPADADGPAMPRSPDISAMRTVGW